ncbi:site-specific integrase [Acidovorax soli]|uniref:Phage integrase family protein n=1 Tax=Acidovorax soli TaxID=592050 RepID=A0A1H3VS78_9BURK|nr:site-specific integrase [Acidovorax soli]SDZ77673.1 Phage integrase family protein [Acidovorax soli]
MASIKERVSKSGVTTYQVQIRRKGYPPISKNFTSKREAQKYATETEAGVLKNEIINPREATKWTIPDLIDWYIENPNEHRKLETKKHFIRLEFLKKEFEHFTVLTLNAKILSKWISQRLKINKPATVYHYYVALKNAMLHHSVQNGYSQEIFNVVKCPTTSGVRDRRFSRDETRKLFKSIHKTSRNKQKEMMISVLFAIETACRVGEMLKLKWNEVYLEEREIKFLAENTKTKTYREIPLTTVAKKILIWIKKNHNPENDNQKRVFDFWHLNEHHLSRQFQICCKRAEIYDIRWHDLRHEGTSRFFEWVNPINNVTLSDIEISEITGHKTMNMLKRYAHLRPSTIVKKLW